MPINIAIYIEYVVMPINSFFWTFGAGLYLKVGVFLLSIVGSRVTIFHPLLLKDTLTFTLMPERISVVVYNSKLHCRKVEGSTVVYNSKLHCKKVEGCMLGHERTSCNCLLVLGTFAFALTFFLSSASKKKRVGLVLLTIGIF